VPRVLCAPDRFRGSMTGIEGATAMSVGAARALPQPLEPSARSSGKLGCFVRSRDAGFAPSNFRYWLDILNPVRVSGFFQETLAF
jgi:hypothetical protein